MTGQRVEQERPDAFRRAIVGRVAVVLAIWIAATLLGLAVAATTRIGPIVLTISAHHGVHVGDLLAFAAAYAAALTATFRTRPTGTRV